MIAVLHGEHVNQFDSDNCPRCISSSFIRSLRSGAGIRIAFLRSTEAFWAVKTKSKYVHDWELEGLQSPRFREAGYRWADSHALEFD
jgi:hypothetical protein